MTNSLGDWNRTRGHWRRSIRCCGDPRLHGSGWAPGIETLTRLREQLLSEEAERQKPRQQWPRQFRFVRAVVQGQRGRPDARGGSLVMDGRRVMPGEVVTLTEGQATAWKDMFEEITGSRSQIESDGGP